MILARRRCAIVVLLASALVGLAAGCTDDGPVLDSRTADGDGETTGTAPPGGGQGVDATASSLVSDTYLSSYELTDVGFGTEVTVTVGDGLRTIEANALPNHQTGSFPNPGNPNSISGQALRYEFPADPVQIGRATPAQTPGVAVNGVSFEPGTAETVTCQSGETYRIEALQGLYDLGLDGNNAHVQPTGKYHYHGLSNSLVGTILDAGGAGGGDLAHIGFAADGHLIVTSTSGAHQPGYRLATEPRSGTGCTYRGAEVALDGTDPDGTYVSDWVHDGSTGDLDACNGTTIGDEYVYLITDAYPFIPRCLMGDFTDPGPGGSGGGGPGGGGGGAGPGQADGAGQDG